MGLGYTSPKPPEYNQEELVLSRGHASRILKELNVDEPFKHFVQQVITKLRALEYGSPELPKVLGMGIRR